MIMNKQLHKLSSMAMEIVISADIHDLGLPDQEAGLYATNDLVSTAIPTPPPLPKLPLSCKLHSDADSGHGGSMLYILPGLTLSDSEFSEEFSSESDTSAASSRRGSEVSSRVPMAPPPPPLPGYLTNTIQLPPQLSEYISHELRASSLQLELVDLRSQRRMRLSRYSSYGSSIYSDEDIQEMGNGGDFIEELITETCIVCYDEKSDFKASGRKCCKSYVCHPCMSAIAHTNINEGLVFIKCPNPSCENGAVGREEILSLVSGAIKDKFERLRLEAEGDGSKKACPNCSYITEHSLPKRYRRYRQENVQITCTKCQHVWCFVCHSPWHQGLTCKQYQKGNLDFKKWTRTRSKTGIANCQKCPLCNVFIQRSTGCDHMTCNRCDTHFCYKCGGRFLDIPGLGDHYQRTSILGCKYNYNAKKPGKRFAMRGGYLGAKMAALTGYPVLFVAGVVVVVAVGAVALPIYGGYRYYKYRKNMKRRYGRHRRH